MLGMLGRLIKPLAFLLAILALATVCMLAGCEAIDPLVENIYFTDVYGDDAYFTSVTIGGVPVIPGVAAPHNLLSATHPDTTVGAAARGDIVTGQGVAPLWTKLAIGGAGTFLSSNAIDASWRALVAGDIPALSGVYVPYVGATANVDLGVRTLTTTGNVGFGVATVADTLVNLFSGTASAGIVRGIDLDQNSASAGAYGIDLAMAGAKTANTYGVSIFNGATSNTGGINKYCLYLRADTVWIGVGSTNYSLYIDTPVGGTTNYSIYSAGGQNYLAGNTGIGLVPDANNVLTVYASAGAADYRALSVSESSNNAGSRGANISVAGAKTAATYGASIYNTATSGTGAIKKYGLYISSTGVWNGALATNYGLYVDAPTGGAANWAAYFGGHIVQPNATYIYGTASGTGLTGIILGVDGSNNINLAYSSVFTGDLKIMSQGGTGRNVVIYGDNATAGSTLKDAPTFRAEARYWSGAASVVWSYNILHDMQTAGGTPKSQAKHSINGVDILVLENDNGTVQTFLNACSLQMSQVGTEPASTADRAGIYAIDLSPLNCTIGFDTETAVLVAGGIASTHKIPIRWNGVTYYLLATNVP
jgi:hypothetical protein